MSGRRDLILHELGLGPLWRLRDAPGRADDEGTPPPAGQMSAPERVADSAADAASAGGGGEVAAVPIMAPSDPAVASGVQAADLDWQQLEAEIEKCTACPLHAKRKMPVPGVGDLRPDWLMVGEGPGAEEDRRGEPFVGPAGQLLDAMLAAVGLSRQRGVFIANAVKCRPPNNRTPETSEVATCFPFLERQVALLRPRLIIALGRPAAQSLLNQEVRISAVRGREFSFADIPVVVTYHPAYLLRNPQDKAKAWQDLCFARRLAPPATD